mmetsp:Transcript_42787/g.107986  ORF Transcript_42787/g.107986 Transcript_42787/m.107986 type:complete len:212 (-) Transcript_42787:623-1258(-)
MVGQSAALYRAVPSIPFGHVVRKALLCVQCLLVRKDLPVLQTHGTQKELVRPLQVSAEAARRVPARAAVSVAIPVSQHTRCVGGAALHARVRKQGGNVGKQGTGRTVRLEEGVVPQIGEGGHPLRQVKEQHLCQLLLTQRAGNRAVQCALPHAAEVAHRHVAAEAHSLHAAFVCAAQARVPRGCLQCCQVHWWQGGRVPTLGRRATRHALQ